MEDHVHNDEVLYRCVFHDNPKNYTLEDGALRVNSSAFMDRSNQISVDRAKLCHNDPSYAQKNTQDGVIMLITREVRGIDDLKYQGKNPIDYDLDVVPDPDLGNNNMAHALIIANPNIENDQVFRRLRRKLMIIANKHGWLIRPQGFR